MMTETPTLPSWPRHSWIFIWLQCISGCRTGPSGIWKQPESFAGYEFRCPTGVTFEKFFSISEGPVQRSASQGFPKGLESRLSQGRLPWDIPT